MKSEIKYRIISVVIDLLTTLSALVLFNAVRFHLFVTDQHDFYVFMTLRSVVLSEILMTGLLMLIYYLSGYYCRTLYRSRVTEFVKTLISTLIGAVIFYFGVLINDSVSDVGDLYEMIGLLWLILFGVVFLGRWFVTIVVYKRVKRRRIGYNTLIIGTSQAALKIAAELSNGYSRSDFNIVGLVDDGHSDEKEINGLPVYRIEDLKTVAEQMNVNRVVVVPCRSGMNATYTLINSLFPMGFDIYVPPTLFYLISGRMVGYDIVGTPLINISNSRLSPMEVSVKRFTDVVLSILALVTIWPVLLTIAILIKHDSKGPVFFKQERIGLNKKKFDIIKFRTMYSNAEESGPALSSANDPRVTKVGRMLRKYRLDELPQFWNVLKGEMSIVGPRPEREYYVDRIVAKAPYYTLVHQLRPGITSLGMVKFGYAENVEQMIERLRYDLIYMENVSLVMDMRIVLYTIKTVATGRGV